MKRLLRNKANYAVLEGLMCSLLNEKFKIKRFLDSERYDSWEPNSPTEYHKRGRGNTTMGRNLEPWKMSNFAAGYDDGKRQHRVQ